MADKKQVQAVVKSADMSEEMQQQACDVAATAFEKYNLEKDIASYIKKEFDKKNYPTWHCIVGRNFGSFSEDTELLFQSPMKEAFKQYQMSYVTHETKHFIYFYIGQVAVLLFKSG